MTQGIIKMKTAKKILQDARQLLDDPAHWTKGCDARGLDGKGTSIYSEQAICWCIGGALFKSAFRMNDGVRETEPSIDRAMKIVRTVLGNENIADFNDAKARTHAEIIHVLDQAILGADLVDKHTRITK